MEAQDTAHQATPAEMPWLRPKRSLTTWRRANRRRVNPAI